MLSRVVPESFNRLKKSKKNLKFCAKLPTSRIDICAHFLANRRANPVRVQEVKKFFNGGISRRAEISFDDGIKRNQIDIGELPAQNFCEAAGVFLRVIDAAD